MNREILFRGKDVSGNWHHGLLTVLKQRAMGVEAGSYISNKGGLPFAFRVRPETIGQLVRLDEHNDMIFHGDVLQDPEIPDENWLVFFDKEGLVWSVKETLTGELMPLSELMEADPEVVGNKWDNLELEVE